MRCQFLVAAAAVALTSACNQAAGDKSGKGPAAPTLAAAMVARAAAPLSRDAALKIMHERHEGMEQIGKSTKAAGRELKSGAPNLATIRTSAATIAGLAPKLSGWVPAGTGSELGKTGAKPAIWEKPQDFAAKTTAFQKAAAGFNAAARAGKINSIGASFADLGKSCKACHDTYRSDTHN